MRSICCVLIGFLIPAQGQESALKFGITVVEGEGAINNVRLRRAKEPVVKVEEDGLPVPGAAVTFQLPAQGAGGVFADDRTSLTVLTDEKGLAVARGLRPNKTLGEFEIRVTASYKGQTASAIIPQTNASPSGGGSSKTLAIVLIVAGAVAGGAAAAAKGGGKSSSSSGSSSSATVSPGSPTFGPPQ